MSRALFVVLFGLFLMVVSCKPGGQKRAFEDELVPHQESLFYADPATFSFDIESKGIYSFEMEVEYSPRALPEIKEEDSSEKISMDILPLHFILKGPEEKDQEDYNFDLELKKEAWMGKKLGESSTFLLAFEPIEPVDLEIGSYSLLTYSNDDNLDDFTGIKKLILKVKRN